MTEDVISNITLLKLNWIQGQTEKQASENKLWALMPTEKTQKQTLISMWQNWTYLIQGVLYLNISNANLKPHQISN